MREVKDLLKGNPLFEGLDASYMDLLGGCGKNIVFEAGETILKEGQPADQFYLVKTGRVSIEIHSPERGALTIQTLEDGDVIGWSWLVPPYKWYFDATATSLVRAFALDAECLRGKFEKDPALGYELMKRFTTVIVDRMQATRLQFLDIYGVHS